VASIGITFITFFVKICPTVQTPKGETHTQTHTEAKVAWWRHKPTSFWKRKLG